MPRLVVLAIALALSVGAGCGIASTTGDLAVVALSGCRYPRACWNTNCACAFATVASCKQCDPLKNGGLDCLCTPELGAVACVEEQQLCVGRGPLCEGRCVRFSSSCTAQDGGDPPESVPDPISTDGGPSLSHRCAYADDVCCPALGQDGGAPDLAPVDQSVPLG